MTIELNDEEMGLLRDLYELRRVDVPDGEVDELRSLQKRGLVEQIGFEVQITPSGDEYLESLQAEAEAAHERAHMPGMV